MGDQHKAISQTSSYYRSRLAVQYRDQRFGHLLSNDPMVEFSVCNRCGIRQEEYPLSPITRQRRIVRDGQPVPFIGWRRHVSQGVVADREGEGPAEPKARFSQYCNERQEPRHPKANQLELDDLLEEWKHQSPDPQQLWQDALVVKRLCGSDELVATVVTPAINGTRRDAVTC